jgi:PAS domain S-box-containing protein
VKGYLNPVAGGLGFLNRTGTIVIAMSAIMLGRRAGIALAVLAVGFCSAALADLLVHGQLTLFEPRVVGVVTAILAGALFARMVAWYRRAQDLQGRTDRLIQLTSELETFIAALEAANQRLQASTARYKGLVDSQGDAILRRTPDGRMTYANEGFSKLFGIRPEDAIGQAFHPEPHPETPPPIFGQLAGRETGRERVAYDHHVKTAAGYRWIAWEDYAIRDAEGRLVEIQSVGRDITDRKNLEAALRDARDKAQEANRAKSRFLATMSHEIRTPMNGVLGMARLLLETQLAPDQKTYSEAIKQSGLSLLALIEDILDFYKIESGALLLEPGEVALRPLLEGIAELLATRAHAKGIEIATAIAPDVPAIIKSDPIRLRQVLTNLVGNAVKFTEEGGVLVSASVERSAEEEGAALQFSVRDTGIGVPPEKQAEIFEDFVQADSSQARRFEGSGLGLAISKRLADAMGGRIGMMSAEDHGSVFWVAFPLAHSAPSEQARPLAGIKVAFVSRSATLRRGVRLQLASAGAELSDARSLEVLLRQRHDCDLVLIDAGATDSEALPDVTELQLPAVALLPPSRRGLLTQLSEKGYRAYLMKPVRQESMEKRLASVISGRGELEMAPVVPETRWQGAVGLSVLLAEDNPINALLARELLRRRGHVVEDVSTGEAAVLACARRRFDLVIMDLHMPGLDGVEAARRIRVAETTAGDRPVPIIALTADALETGRKACLEAGMDGFLTKPVDPAELDAVLATLVPRSIIAAE